MPNFEVFHKRSTPEETPTVTIQKRGTISLNRPAWLLLSCPSKVTLLFDREERIMGIAAAMFPADPDTYPLRPVGNPSPEFAKSFVLSGKGFTKFYGIETEPARRWPAYLQDGVLCVDVSEPGALATNKL